MQVQPYQPNDPSPIPNGPSGRIVVPTGGGTAPPPVPPSMVAVFVQEIKKRRSFVGAWLVVTVVLAVIAALAFGRPMYRAEGHMSYKPNYRTGLKPLYNPPNIQTILQEIKSPEVLEAVRQKHQDKLSNMSADTFASHVRVVVAQQSENIDVTFEHPNAEWAATIANDLMREAKTYYDRKRTATIKTSGERLEADLKAADADKQRASEALLAACKAKGVPSLLVDIEVTHTAIADIEKQLRDAKQRQLKIDIDIKELEARRDAPSDAKDQGDESFFLILQAMMTELQTKLQNTQTIETAKAKLEAARKEEARRRVLVAKGILTQSDYDQVVQEIVANEAIVKQAAENEKLQASLKKMHDELREKAKNNRPLRKAIVEELERAKVEKVTLPATIQRLTEEVASKKADLDKLTRLKLELGAEENAVKQADERIKDYNDQLKEAKRSYDQNADDLTIKDGAKAATAPHSSNTMKLALAVIGASLLLLLGYLGFYALPQLQTAPTSPSPTTKPTALVALVPVTPEPKPDTAALPPTPLPLPLTDAGQGVALPPTPLPGFIPLSDVPSTKKAVKLGDLRVDTPATLPDIKLLDEAADAGTKAEIILPDVPLGDIPLPELPTPDDIDGTATQAEIIIPTIPLVKTTAKPEAKPITPRKPKLNLSNIPTPDLKPEPEASSPMTPTGDAKPVPPVERKPEPTKLVSKIEPKLPEATIEPKPERRGETKPNINASPEPKPVTKSETKPESKPVVKIESMPVPKAATPSGPPALADVPIDPALEAALDALFTSTAPLASEVPPPALADILDLMLPASKANTPIGGTATPSSPSVPKNVTPPTPPPPPKLAKPLTPPVSMPVALPEKKTDPGGSKRPALRLESLDKPTERAAPPTVPDTQKAAPPKKEAAKPQPEPTATPPQSVTPVPEKKESAPVVPPPKVTLPPVVPAAAKKEPSPPTPLAPASPPPKATTPPAEPKPVVRPADPTPVPKLKLNALPPSPTSSTPTPSSSDDTKVIRAPKDDTIQPVKLPKPAVAPLPRQPVQVAPPPPRANIDYEAVAALAKRIAEERSEQGKIVLFAPTAEQIQVTPLVSDIGQAFTRQGNRVLIFDARNTTEVPTWAGPHAPMIAKRVESYLEGHATGSSQCFVPTTIHGIEYSRANVAQSVAGVLASHRFRQLVEEMRERYSIVLMVTPPVALAHDNPLLPALAEGMVLVTENEVSPADLHHMINALREQFPTTVYGALTAPKA